MQFKLSFAKWWPFCLGLNVLNALCCDIKRSPSTLRVVLWGPFVHDETSYYCNISQKLWHSCVYFQLLWNLSGISAVILPSSLPIFKVIWTFYHPILRFKTFQVPRISHLIAYWKGPLVYVLYHQFSPSRGYVNIKVAQQMRMDAARKMAATQIITCVHTCAVAEHGWSRSKICSARNGSNTQFCVSAKKPCTLNPTSTLTDMADAFKALCHPNTYIWTCPW